jgi:hypothetical protein
MCNGQSGTGGDPYFAQRAFGGGAPFNSSGRFGGSQGPRMSQPFQSGGMSNMPPWMAPRGPRKSQPFQDGTANMSQQRPQASAPMFVSDPGQPKAADPYLLPTPPQPPAPPPPAPPPGTPQQAQPSGNMFPTPAVPTWLYGPTAGMFGAPQKPPGIDPSWGWSPGTGQWGPQPGR